MGVGMDLDFEKYCKVDQSPRTVLQSPHHHAKHESKSRQSNSSSRNSRMSLEAGFKEIKFRNYHRSVSCKTLPTQSNELAIDREVLKRGSVYQCSKERRSFKKNDDIGGRKKIELSLKGNSPFSFSLLDSICGEDEEEQQEEKRSSRSSNRMRFDMRAKNTSKPAERDGMKSSKLESHEVVGPSSSGNILEENDNQALLKSLSSKLALPHSPTHSQSDVSKVSSVSRLTPIKKMLDPLTKSNSHQTPLSSKLENGVSRSSTGLPSSGKSKTLQKSLLHDFSTPVSPSSPAHLHGDIKLERKNGVSYFELYLGHSENVLVAKTWKTEDALNWAYTFHSIPSRKRSNASGKGVMHSSNKDSLPPMVGQMQVSCHLCSTQSKGGSFNNSMMTEFVLYDIMHARKSFASEESEAGEARASNEGLNDPSKLKTQAANASERGSMNFSVPCAATDLHPSHEIAAVAIQVPFRKRQDSNLLDLSFAEQKLKVKNGNSTSTRVCVVTPVGNHSLPSCESRGPSPLLDRWRLGGGCDCGGWDMACPLSILNNSRTRCKEENHSPLQGDQPFSLHFQGAKEKSSALTIKLTQKGQYSVDFHARLSALQALGICVAILHSTEASFEVDQEKHRQLLQCSAMKVFVEDEVKLLIEAVTEEKEKEKTIRDVEDQPSSFVLNPPFSPIARV